jgi:DNA polymerase-3 subunit delta
LGEKPDPFSLVELRGDELKGQPAKLLDECLGFVMGGGDKVIYVREAQDFLAATLDEAASACPDSCTIVVEASELGPKSALRQFAETTDNAAAIPAYDDEGFNLEKFVRAELAADKISYDATAFRLLISLLSPNRALNRQELLKIKTYLGDEKNINEDVVLDCLMSQAALGLDDIAYATLGGDEKTLIRSLERLKAEGLPPITLLRSVGRHIHRLHLVASELGRGASLSSVVENLRPPIFFKKKDAFMAQCRLWPAGHLQKALMHLEMAERRSKTTGLPADEITGQSLLTICAQAKALSRRAA